ncbi:MAG: UDP-N-acetylmuramoyl-tripeptide--D-alanyl-D-alanine ligase [Candidatus Pacebacteria bacterium]|nr:UDP-N-acetylmuramoyl-tripeptide--D-alanyl-D-alanine ligase [Candidatus Paceibacterota bacterium]
MIYFLTLFWSLKEIQSALFYLHLCQLKEYHLGRFLVHFKTSQGKSLILNKLILLKIIILFFLLTNFWSGLAIFLLFLLYLVEFLNIAFKIIQDRLIKPVFTKKVLFLIFVLFLIIFSYLIVLLLSIERIYLPLLIVDILSPILFPLLVFILQPLTILERKRILEKATKKRQSCKNLLVIGITGSYGKTTTKEFLAIILSQKFNVLKTQNHKNSEMGISQTILEELNNDHEIFIGEMAAYNKGGIKLLADIIHPKIGIITGINEQHLALFGSMENLIQAEGGKELLEYVDIAFFNGNDKLCQKVYEETKIKKKLCSIKKESDFWISDYKTDLNYIYCTIENKESINLKIKAHGVHNLSNLLLAIAVARYLDMDWEEIKKGCLKIDPEMTGIKTYKSKHGFLIIDSSYSANPTGVLADLKYLSLYSGKKVIVMPCLIELGSASKKIHEKIGRKIDEVCDLAIITTPDNFKDLNSKKAIYVQKPNQIISKLKSFCSGKDTVLIEGRIKKEIIKKL